MRLEVCSYINFWVVVWVHGIAGGKDSRNRQLHKPYDQAPLQSFPEG